MGRPEKALISRERAARAALDIIDVQGLDGLSLDLVAKRLGVKAPSLYHHFKGKSELLSDVALCILRDIRPEVHDGMPWEETLIRVCTAARRTILLHPNAAPLLLEHFPRHIFLERYDYWTSKCPYPPEMHLVIIEGTDKLTYGSALFAAAARSRGKPEMPDFDVTKFPHVATAVRASPFNDEGLFVESLRYFLAGLREQLSAPIARQPVKAKRGEKAR